MDNFKKISNVFKNSFVSQTINLIYIDMVILLYPISLVIKSIFMKISNIEVLILLILNLILIISSILVKMSIVKKNSFNYSLYIKIYATDNPRSTIRKCINNSISNFCYRWMSIFHLSIYLQIYILSLVINGNIKLNIISIIFSIFGTGIVLYPTAIASIKDWRKTRIELLDSMEEI